MRLVPPPGRTIEGQIVFEGTDLLEKDNKEMHQIRGWDISMIFQEPTTSLNPVLTIGLQITESMEIHLGRSREAAQARAIELLELVQIPDPEQRLSQFPHQFSGGMRQRVMLAMAPACPKWGWALSLLVVYHFGGTWRAVIREIMPERSYRWKVACPPPRAPRELAQISAVWLVRATVPTTAS